MNKLGILVFLIVGFLSSCEKNSNNDNPADNLDSLLIIGEAQVKLTLLDTTIYPSDRCDSLLYEIDIDSDGINDFQFYVYYCYSPCIYMSNMRLDCLTKNSKILTNDTIQTPEILDISDTLQSKGNWISQRFDMLSTSGMSGLCDGDGIIHTYGNWHDLTNKYIGIKIEKEDYIILGWIKLSINKTNNDFPIELHEIGYKKAAYNNVYSK
jgi:hypothetical protein